MSFFLTDTHVRDESFTKLTESYEEQRNTIQQNIYTKTQIPDKGKK